MKGRNGQNRRAKPYSNASEIGVVRVFSNPGPDAEDRLRRLFTLLIRYAMESGQTTPEEEAPSKNDSRTDD